MEEEILKVLATSKGRSKLYDGKYYIHQHEKDYKATKYWKCKHRGCKKRIHTVMENEEYKVIKTANVHDHVASSSKVLVLSTSTS